MILVFGGILPTRPFPPDFLALHPALQPPGDCDLGATSPTIALHLPDDEDDGRLGLVRPALDKLHNLTLDRAHPGDARLAFAGRTRLPHVGFDLPLSIAQSLTQGVGRGVVQLETPISDRRLGAATDRSQRLTQPIADDVQIDLRITFGSDSGGDDSEQKRGVGSRIVGVGFEGEGYAKLDAGGRLGVACAWLRSGECPSGSSGWLTFGSDSGGMDDSEQKRGVGSRRQERNRRG